MSEVEARAAAAEAQLTSAALARQRARSVSAGEVPAASEMEEMQVKLSDAEANIKCEYTYGWSG